MHASRFLVVFPLGSQSCGRDVSPIQASTKTQKKPPLPRDPSEHPEYSDTRQPVQLVQTQVRPPEAYTTSARQ